MNADTMLVRVYLPDQFLMYASKGGYVEIECTPKNVKLGGNPAIFWLAHCVPQPPFSEFLRAAITQPCSIIGLNMHVVHQSVMFLDEWQDMLLHPEHWMAMFDGIAYQPEVEPSEYEILEIQKRKEEKLVEAIQRRPSAAHIMNLRVGEWRFCLN